MGKPKLPKIKDLFPKPKEAVKGAIYRIKSLAKPKQLLQDVKMSGAALLSGDPTLARNIDIGVIKARQNQAVSDAHDERVKASQEEQRRQAEQERQASLPVAPTQDQAGINARLLSDRLRRRRGVLANIYAGKSAIG